jgi:polar amino acid transport system substrate-binding protein
MAAVTLAPPVDPKVFDLAMALRCTGGRPALLREMLQRFAEAHADTVNTLIKQAIDPARHAEAIREAHTLKGLAGMLGLPAVAAAAAQVEKRLRLKEEAPPLSRSDLPLVDLGQALRAALQAVPEITAHLKD